MNWREPVFDYCERRSGAFWAEPANALTNAAFLLAAAAAYALWRRRGGTDYPALALIVATASVGVGSFIFHTVATRGAMLLDVIPIAIFVCAYFFLALRRLFGLSGGPAFAITLLFAAFSGALDASVSGLNGSVGYLPALGALALFATLLLAEPADGSPRTLRRRRAAREIALAAGVFLVSLFFRTVDRAVCEEFPLGAHFLWHMLNACALWLLLRAVIQAGPREA